MGIEFIKYGFSFTLLGVNITLKVKGAEGDYFYFCIMRDW